MVTSALKALWEKGLDRNIAPSPHCPLSLAFSRRPFLSMGLPSTENLLPPSYRKMREAQNTLYIARPSPNPLEADERVPSRCTTPTPFLCDPRAPQL